MASAATTSSTNGGGCSGVSFSTGDAKSVVDMRSDTVTHPTSEMRDAMRDAVVGDDVMMDDPTVLELEATAAKMFGKEAALFVPSGTMSNLIAIMCHCSERGSEFIVGDKAHIFLYEQGGSATLAGAHARALPTNADGTLNLADIEGALRADDPHQPVSKLVCLENTHNVCGGAVLDAAYIDSVGALAHKHGLKLHMDGARIFNAATALGVSVDRLTQSCDSISCCLSKGLAAPIGSVLIGTKALMYKARRWRKALGGGMRQVGVLAAPALLSLRVMTKRLGEDHTRAKALAEGLAKVPGIEVDPASVQSNIVMFHIAKTGLTGQEFVKAMAAHGVKIGAKSSTKIRACVHYQVDDAGIEQTIDAAKAVVAAVSATAGAK